MRILFVTDLHHLPQRHGEAQVLIHELALEFQASGHQPAVLAALHPAGALGWRSRVMRRLSGATAHDTVMGYPVWRRAEPNTPLDAPIAGIRPDAAIVLPRAAVPMAAELRRLGVPVVVYFQDVEFDQLGGDPRELSDVVFAANSEFTARRCREAFGLTCAVVPPVIRGERYRNAARKPANVTMIDPHPLNGGDLALEIAAACPEIPFRFISGEAQSSELRSLRERVARLPNARLEAPARDRRRVYRGAKIVLAPSQREEAWGRVATEAQFSGIPVVASDRGGLREAVGLGGLLLDPDAPADAWIDAVRRLWTDKSYYRQKSDAALVHSQRLAIAPERLVTALLALARASDARLDTLRTRQKTAGARTSTGVA